MLAQAAAAGRSSLGAAPQALIALGHAFRQLSTETTSLKAALAELIPGQQVKKTLANGKL